ncbi:MAG: alpha-amylase family glycosyl hydrolase [Bacillota bacterium]
MAEIEKYEKIFVNVGRLLQMKPKCPAWVHDAVFYEIYPQTFYDFDGDGIGDIPGITVKLDYVKSLGVSAVWLNPCYVSPFRDAGYDVADYYRVAPRYGTNEDMKKLFAEAKKRDLRVILDFVPGHTSIDHPWFRESCKPERNKYTNWYIWTDNTWDMGGGEFAGKFIHGWCERNGNFLTNFFWSQPALNFGFGKPDPDKAWQLPTDHPDILALRKEIKGILRFWLDMGASGFRVDMAGSIIRRDPGGREAAKFWREVRAMLEADYPDAFLVSEWSWPKAALRAGFHADFLHWVESYQDLFRKESRRALNGLSEGQSYFDAEGRGDISRFLECYLDQLDATRSKGYISIPVGNHDLSRINIARSHEELEIIYAFLFTMPGVPFFYYGDEIGMRHLDGLPNKEGAYRPRSGARTPMQWTAGKNAGFSSAPPDKLYLPVDSAPGAPSVEEQEKNPCSLLNRVRHLIRLRRFEKGLAAYADFIPLYAKRKKYPFIYMRSNGRARVLVALNPSRSPSEARLKLSGMGREPEMLAGWGTELAFGPGTVSIAMEGRSYGMFRV